MLLVSTIPKFSAATGTAVTNFEPHSAPKVLLAGFELTD